MAKINKFFNWYLCLMAAFLIIFMLFILNYRLIVVTGDSMLPTLSDSQIMIGKKALIPVRGKIYAIQEPDSGNLAIKRLIGCPGDVVELKNGATYVNGELYMEEPGNSWDYGVWHLGAEEYLFMGDNRGASYDGRFWSRPLYMSEIIYEASFRIYPFDKLGKVM